MCGILCWFSADAAEAPPEGPCSTALDRLVHRGPDESRIVRGPGHWLGHRRLHITGEHGDSSPRAAQPFSDGERLCVMNGQVYNYRALMADLPDCFDEKDRDLLPDGAVILPLFERHGLQMPERLSGMYALAVFDRDTRKLVLARDPLGIKPLHVGLSADGARLVVASERRALDGWDGWRLQEVEPGSCQQWSVDPAVGRWRETSRSRHSRLSAYPLSACDLEDEREAGRALWAALDGAVASHLPAPARHPDVACLLSGGLDSALVAALAARHLGPGQRLHTFAIGDPRSAPPGSDLATARAVAAAIGSTHHEIALDHGTLESTLPVVADHLDSSDPDIFRAAPAKHAVYGAIARAGIRVALTGQGADEILGGYGWFGDAMLENEAASLRFHAEILQKTFTLHRGILQSEDHLSMAHGIESRVPFLDRDVVDVALRIPPRLKQHPFVGGRRVEKALLRDAARTHGGFDPGGALFACLDRPKVQFGDSLGADWDDFLARCARCDGAESLGAWLERSLRGRPPRQGEAWRPWAVDGPEGSRWLDASAGFAER